MKKILFIGTGNVNQSPLAAEVLKKKAKSNNIDIFVYSAGLEPFHIGDPTNKIIQEIATENGIDMSQHHSKLFKKSDFDNFDDIYIMVHKNYKDVKYFSDNESQMEKVEYLMNLIEPNSQKSVPNPNELHKDQYSAFYKILDRACNKIIKNITK